MLATAEQVDHIEKIIGYLQRRLSENYESIWFGDYVEGDLSLGDILRQLERGTQPSPRM